MMKAPQSVRHRDALLRWHASRMTTRSHRRAFTLIELVATLSIASLVAMMATTILFSMLQQHATVRQRIQISGSQVRLAERFRNDVQQAHTAETSETEIVLEGPRGKVRYARVRAGTLRRTISIDGVPRADDFDLPAQHELLFSVEDVGDHKLVTLATRPPPNPPEQQTRAVSDGDVSIVAELARAHRWVASQ